MTTATMPALRKKVVLEPVEVTYFYLVDENAPAEVEGNPVFYTYPVNGRLVVRIHPEQLEQFFKQCRQEGVFAEEITIADLVNGAA